METARIGVILALAGTLGFHSGCGGSKSQRVQEEPPVNASLERLATQQGPLPVPVPSYNQEELDTLARQTLNLQAMLEAMPVEPMPEPPPERTPEPPPVVEVVVTAPAAAPEPPPVPEPVVVKPPPRPVAERTRDASLLVVDLLRQQATESGSLNAYLALAGMEFIMPGALQTIITPTTTQGAAISPEDALAVGNLHQFLAAIAPASESTTLQQRITEHQWLLTSGMPMRMRNVQLCREVSGFGQYTPLGVSRFAAGQPIRAVVYAEVENFQYREVSELDRMEARISGRELRDQWAVELTQELRLYRAADNLLVWSRPEQALVETSRNKRRDFYLVQTVALPSTLTVGSYSLKVTVRDRTGDAVDEVNLPIDIVADGALAAELPR